MALDATTRLFLEQTIDTVVQNVHNLVKVFFNPDVRAQLHIQNQDDFVLGTGLGIIQQTFFAYFVSEHGRYPNEQEHSETVDIILRRAADIRNAIFKVE